METHVCMSCRRTRVVRRAHVWMWGRCRRRPSGTDPDSDTAQTRERCSDGHGRVQTPADERHGQTRRGRCARTDADGDRAAPTWQAAYVAVEAGVRGDTQA